MNEKTETVAAANRMTKVVAELNGQLEDLRQGRAENAANIRELTTYGERNRKLIHLLIATCVFDICLSLLLAFATYTAVHASNQAKEATSVNRQLHNQAVAQCESGNDFRRLDRERWQQIIDLTSARQQTPEQVETTRKFIEIIDKADAPRDCSQVR